MGGLTDDEFVPWALAPSTIDFSVFENAQPIARGEVPLISREIPVPLLPVLLRWWDDHCQDVRHADHEDGGILPTELVEPRGIEPLTS